VPGAAVLGHQAPGRGRLSAHRAIRVRNCSPSTER
jgi:hypothetical protein